MYAFGFCVHKKALRYAGKNFLKKLSPFWDFGAYISRTAHPGKKGEKRRQKMNEKEIMELAELVKEWRNTPKTYHFDT